MTTAPRILLVSLGSIGRRHLRNIRTLIPDADLCVWRHKPGAVPPEAEGLQIVCSEADAQTFAPDAVIVSSPASLHANQCRVFSAKGVPVFVEKPLEVSAERILPLEAALAEGNALMFVGYVLRFQPILGSLRDKIQNGFIGDVRTAHISTGQYLPDWRPDSDYRTGVSAQADLGGGVLLELSHELDYARWLFGHPTTVTAETGNIGALDIDVEDHATVIYGYTDKQISISIDFLQRVPCMTLKVVGSDGTLHADLIEETAVLLTPDGRRELEVPRLETGNEMYLRQFDAFLTEALEDYVPRYASSKNAPFSRFEDAKAVLQLVDAARLSARNGRRVAV